MNKTLKITINILIFILIAGFGYYMVHSIVSDEKKTSTDAENQETDFVSPYKKTDAFDAVSEILSFDIYDDMVFAALQDKISVFDLDGNHQYDFEIKSLARDIVAVNDTVFILYPTEIELYTFEGQIINEWEACSENSDYCAFTTTKDYVFVTDAENKHIVQYDKQGRLVRFIKSPRGFVIPSYAFDIISINDTIYCSNSGKHKIESYTSDGIFIASFGESGMEAGEFAGCCNPVFLEKTAGGNILTSEKGNPRVSSYSKEGKFRTILLDNDMLGGGTSAYRMKVSKEKIYIAGKKTISVYDFDCKLLKKPCGACELECPLNIN